MSNEIKITHVKVADGAKAEKVLKPRPAFTLPIVYVMEDGSEYSGLARLTKKSELLPHVEDLAKAAAKGALTAKVQGNMILCVSRLYHLG